MSTTSFYMGSLRYDPTGRKRKNHALKSTRRKRVPAYQQGTLKTPQHVLNRMKEAKEHQEKYPSMMEQQVKAGTFISGGHTTAKKEAEKYTGTLVKGIATMHKSNAVPVINQQEATDIARMRRG